MTINQCRRNFLQQTTRFALATPFISLIPCENAHARRLTQLTGTTMGTTYQIKIPQMPGDIKRQDVERDIAGILETVNLQMSTFRADSELSRFNASIAAISHQVSSDTVLVVDAALRISRLSAGAFDPTIGPLVDLWGFGAGRTGQGLPARNWIRKTLQAIGYRNVRTKSIPPVLVKHHDDISLDLSGIAKGFAVDKVAQYLERIGVVYYLVEIGGELRGRGYNHRSDEWRVGIEIPDSKPRAVQRVVRLSGKALATSGDYRIFFERDGLKYSHILDPRTGRPVNQGLASVTVIADTTMVADALSTALMVLGAGAGLDLAKRENIAAFFIAKKEGRFVETASPNFKPYLVA